MTMFGDREGQAGWDKIPTLTENLFLGLPLLCLLNIERRMVGDAQKSLIQKHH